VCTYQDAIVESALSLLGMGLWTDKLAALQQAVVNSGSGEGLPYLAFVLLLLYHFFLMTLVGWWAEYAVSLSKRKGMQKPVMVLLAE
jgi:hypothetical protein